jgi:prepilin-type N-terminal cleavage/methylation domain-containing protein
MTEYALKTRSDSNNGFTLIEMAIVVVIIGILMAAGLRVASVQRDSAAYSATRTKQEAIKQALINYLRNNQRLPCPDTKVGGGNTPSPGTISFGIAAPPDGIENRAAAAVVPDVTVGCDVRFGVLPWVTLGLPRDAAIDGFGNFFTYAVSADPSSANDWNETATFNTGLLGGFTVNSRANNALAVSLNEIAVVVVVSHGKDGLGAWAVKGTQNVMPLTSSALLLDEGENANDVGATYYVIRDTNNDSTSNGGAFDDVVLPITPGELTGPLTQEQSLKSNQAMAAQASQDIVNINNALVGYVMVNFSLPYADGDGLHGCGGTQNDGQADPGCTQGNIPWVTLGVAANDPWNRPYKYAMTAGLGSLATLNIEATYKLALGAINVSDGSGVPLVTTPNLLPFVVYSLGSNNQNNKCSNPAAGGDIYPATPPNCYGSNENNLHTGTLANPFIKQAINIPVTGALAITYYDDVLDYVSQSTIIAKLP